MAKTSNNTPLEICGRLVKPGEQLSFGLEVPDLYVNTGLAIPVSVIRGKRDGPALLLCAAIHGNEINGVEIIRRILGTKMISSIRGTLIAVPIVNIFGFINQSRYLPDRRDLNRVFPGIEKGSLASRMAHLFVTEILSKCTHGIDLHTGAINRENLPQIRAAVDDPDLDQMSRAFGLPVILNARNVPGSLRETATSKGVKMIVYEAGEALRFDETSIRGGVHGVLSVMRHLGMLANPQRKKRLMDPFYAKYSSWIRAPKSGIHRSIRALGESVNKEDILGLITDPMSKNEVPVITPGQGIIIGRTTIPLVNEGEALFHIASFDDSSGDVMEQLDQTHQALDQSNSFVLPDEPTIV